MYRNLQFIILGAFLAIPKAYWIVLFIIIAFDIVAICVTETAHLGDYTEPEQYYDVQVGFIVEDGKAIPKQIFYKEDGKRKPIPPKNVTLSQRPNSDIYDTYARIRRKDGTGYDYIAAVMERVSDTEYRTIKVSCGREIA